MANWCVNWVTVEGEEANVSSLMDEVSALSVKADVEDRGVRPSDEGNLRYMFFIYVNDGYSFSFESKWSPANDSLQFLAKKYQVTIVNRYSELGCMVFGQWVGDGETEEDVHLTKEEMELAVPGDEDGSYYTYEGEKYENEEEILNIILDNKIKN